MQNARWLAWSVRGVRLEIAECRLQVHGQEPRRGPLGEIGGRYQITEISVFCLETSEYCDRFQIVDGQIAILKLLSSLPQPVTKGHNMIVRSGRAGLTASSEAGTR